MSRTSAPPEDPAHPSDAAPRASDAAPRPSEDPPRPPDAAPRRSDQAPAPTLPAPPLAGELGLAPHPEGGWYREIHRASAQVATARGPRAASTTIHFLLGAGDFSAWHRVVASDEIWAWQAGSPIDLHLLGPAGHRVVRLGVAVGAGERPAFVVPAGEWQAAEPAGDGCALCTCVVAPGFDFADFEMAERARLAEAYPVHAAVVTRLTRPG